MSFLASVCHAGPSLFTAEALEEERTNHLNINFRSYLPKRRKISLLGYAEYCPTTEHGCSLEAIESHHTRSQKQWGDLLQLHWSQRGPDDLGTQKNSEEGLEGHAMVFSYLNTHTAY